jgi:hypothetical protein
LPDFLGIEEINPVLVEVLQAFLFVPFKQRICILSIYYTYNRGYGKERELRKSLPVMPSGELWQINKGKTSLYLELSECGGHVPTQAGSHKVLVTGPLACLAADPIYQA